MSNPDITPHEIRASSRAFSSMPISCSTGGPDTHNSRSSINHSADQSYPTSYRLSYKESVPTSPRSGRVSTSMSSRRPIPPSPRVFRGLTGTLKSKPQECKVREQSDCHGRRDQGHEESKKKSPPHRATCREPVGNYSRMEIEPRDSERIRVAVRVSSLADTDQRAIQPSRN